MFVRRREPAGTVRGRKKRARIIARFRRRVRYSNTAVSDEFRTHAFNGCTMTNFDADEPICPMCRHAYPPRQMSKHHLVPKSRKGTETVLLCNNCHQQIHAVYTEKELEANFGTLEDLLGAEQLQPWIRWVRKRKPQGRLKTRTSKRKRR